MYGTQGFQAFAYPIEGRSKVAQVIGAMGEAGVIRKTTDPGVQLIDYPYRERRASPWM